MNAPRRREGLHVREIDGETVVLDPRTERMHTLNATAAFIFHSIDGARGVDAIAADFSARFDVGPEVAVRDTEEVIAKLRSLDMVVSEERGETGGGTA